MASGQIIRIETFIDIFVFWIALSASNTVSKNVQTNLFIYHHIPQKGIIMFPDIFRTLLNHKLYSFKESKFKSANGSSLSMTKCRIIKEVDVYKSLKCNKIFLIKRHHPPLETIAKHILCVISWHFEKLWQFMRV